MSRRPLHENDYTHGWKPQAPWRDSTDEQQDFALESLEATHRTVLTKPRELKLCQQLASLLQRAADTRTPLDGSLKPFYQQQIDHITHYPKYKRFLSKLLSNVTFM